METYNILNGKLGTDLDTPYCEVGNKIDVYCTAYWTARTKKQYEAKEKLISKYKKETDLFKLFAWCDISGYEYWVKQQEECNYVSIDVVLKKQPNEYTQEEMQIIRDAIIEADEYFIEILM